MTMKLSKMLSNHCTIRKLKTFKLELNFSLTSNKVPNMGFVTSSVMNTASVANKKLQ